MQRRVASMSGEMRQKFTVSVLATTPPPLITTSPHPFNRAGVYARGGGIVQSSFSAAHRQMRST